MKIELLTSLADLEYKINNQKLWKIYRHYVLKKAEYYRRNLYYKTWKDSVKTKKIALEILHKVAKEYDNNNCRFVINEINYIIRQINLNIDIEQEEE